MGNSDLYRLQPKDTLELKDTLPPRYLWVDGNINNTENKAHYTMFLQNDIEITKFESFQTLKKEVERQPHYVNNIRIVCASSFDDIAYEYIQQSSKIDRVLLFCSKRERAEDLMKRFSKIKVACFGSWDIVLIIKVWKKESQSSMFVFEEGSIGNINRHYANIMAITDKQDNILMNQAKDHFENYRKKIVIKQRRQVQKIVREYQKCWNNQQLMVSFLEKQFVQYSDQQPNPLASVINQLLVSTFKPKKIAYLRYFKEIFHSIRRCHQVEGEPIVKEYYALVEFNQAQFKKISQSKSKYMMLTYFLHASAERSQKALMNHQVDLIITIPQKAIGKFNTGYFQRDGKIVFNLGNYFQINNFSRSSKTLTVSLLEISDGIEPRFNDEKDYIYLNRIYQERLHGKYNGQWYSLLLNNDEEDANIYIGEKVKNLSKKQTQKLRVIKYKISMVARKLKNNINNAVQELEILIDQIQRSPQIMQLIECRSLGCEFFFDQNRVHKFNEYLMKFEQYKSFFISKDLKVKQDLLTVFASAFINQPSRQELQYHLSGLQKFEDKFMSNIKQYVCNDLYPFILKVKLKGLIQLSEVKKATETLNLLLKWWKTCEGTSSVEIVKLNRCRIDIENRRKTQLYISRVKLEDLRSDDYLLKVNDIDFSLYQ